VAGKAVTEGGVMVDLSLMKGVYVDPVARTARAQTGLTWGELNRETALHGLAVTGGTVSATGVAGYTLGGGLGYLMSRDGLAVDNLLSVELVTADGQVLRASGAEHADLFWALRGAGANFGVATSFEFALHPVGPTVTAGLVLHPFAAARDFLRFVRAYTADLSDDLTMFAGLLHAPDGSGTPLAGAVVCHVGPPEEAYRELAPLLGYGAPLDVPVGDMPYTTANTLIDAAFPTGAFGYWKSAFLPELSDAAIDVMVDRFADCPSPVAAMVFEHLHGAVTRVAPDATAFPHRTPGYNLILPTIWLDPETTDANIAWTCDTFEAMRPFTVASRYVNYMSADDASAVREAFGPNYERLLALKQRYDPDNLFRLNQNIPPG
jgi:FAD/FMN-containing dehydrogenase